MDWPRRERATTAIPAPAAITRCWPLAAGTGEVLMSRLREGRANTARGAAHFLRETVGRGALRRGQGTTHGAGRQRLLRPHCRCRLPGNGCPLLYHHPPARQPAGPDRGDTRGGLDSHSLLDGRRRRCRRDDLHPVPDQAGRPAGAAHCPAGEGRRPVPSSPSSPDTAITPSSPTAMGRRWNWRPIIAATPRSRTPYATSSTASG